MLHAPVRPDHLHFGPGTVLYVLRPKYSPAERAAGFFQLPRVLAAARVRRAAPVCSGEPPGRHFVSATGRRDHAAAR